MARFNFGATADYSTLFARDYYQAQAQQKAQTVADQNAMDSDTYNQWQQGMISDSDWLNYIAGRVTDTANDQTPAGVKSHEHWVTMQREYTNSIADNQAQYAYQNGGSINDYIAYLQNRVAGLDPNSQDYRKVALELSNAQDTRAQNDVSSGAQSIIDGIQSGSKSYKDLLTFYQGALKSGQIRATSQLYKDVTKQVESVENQIKSDDIQSAFGKLQYQWDSGKLNGSQVAAQMRSLANTYYKNDPSKYYSTLDTALKYDRYGGRSLNTATGRVNGTGGSSRLTSAQKTLLDTQSAYLKAYDSAAKQIADGQTTITMPDGKGGLITVPNNADTQRQVYLGYLSQADANHATLMNDGKQSRAQTVANDKQGFIYKYIQPSNTLAVKDYTTSFLTATMQQFDALAKTNDPQALLNLSKDMAMQFASLASGLQHSQTTNDRAAGVLPTEFQPTPRAIHELAAMSQLFNEMAQPNATRQDLLDFISKNAIGGGVVPSSIVTELLNTLAGPENPGSKEIAGAGPQVAALSTNTGARVIDADGTIHVVPVKPGINGPVPQFGSYQKSGDQMTQILVDVNGRPTSVWAVATPYSDPNYQVWKVNSSGSLKFGSKSFGKGQTLTDAAISQVSPAAWQQMIDEGLVVKSNAKMPNLYQVNVKGYSDAGHTIGDTALVWDRSSGTWYTGGPGSLPIQFVQGSQRQDGTVAVNADGSLAMNWRPFGSAAGAPLGYVGSQGDTVQQLWNQAVATKAATGQATGLLALTGGSVPGTRGATGQVVGSDAHTWDHAFVGYDMVGAKADGGADDNWAAKVDPADQIKHAQQVFSQAQTRAAQANYRSGERNTLSPVADLAVQAGLNLGRNVKPTPQQPYAPTIPMPGLRNPEAQPTFATLPDPTLNSYVNQPVTSSLPSLPLVSLPAMPGLRNPDMPSPSSPASTPPPSEKVVIAGRTPVASKLGPVAE